MIQKTTEFTKRQILKIFKLKTKNKPVVEISRVLNRSKCETYRVPARKNNFDEKTGCGMPRVTSVESGKYFVNQGKRRYRLRTIYIKKDQSKNMYALHTDRFNISQVNLRSD